MEGARGGGGVNGVARRSSTDSISTLRLTIVAGIQRGVAYTRSHDARTHPVVIHHESRFPSLSLATTRSVAYSWCHGGRLLMVSRRPS
jgi:hypothetical protein